MNRFLRLVLALVVVCVQSLSVHAHLPHADDTHAQHGDHGSLHVHSHAMGDSADETHEYSDATAVDLLASARVPFAADTSPVLPVFAVLVLLLVLWISLPRLLHIPVIPRTLKPHSRPSAPRAPPR